MARVLTPIQKLLGLIPKYPHSTCRHPKTRHPTQSLLLNDSGPLWIKCLLNILTIHDRAKLRQGF